MRILTCDEVGNVERNAAGLAQTSELVLIQRAAYAVAQFCLAHFKFQTVCAVCGGSSHGAVGLIAAQVLSDTAELTSIIVLGRDTGELGAEATAIASDLTVKPIWISDEADFQDPAVQKAIGADLIIDAVAGPGFKPPLKGIGREAVEAINRVSGTVVSIDVPSGADADSTFPLHQGSNEAVYSHGVVALVAPKPAHVFGDLTSGPIAVSELGVQPALVSRQTGLSVTTGQEVQIAFPPRRPAAHKGDFGHVLVLGGSLSNPGAAALSGIAALRAGAGLATVACPVECQPIIAGFAPELMTESFSAREEMRDLLVGKSAVVFGPGLLRNARTMEIAEWLGRHCPLPVIFNGEGLSASLSENVGLKSASSTFRVALFDMEQAAEFLGIPINDFQADKAAGARSIAEKINSCVVLQGFPAAIAGSSGETWINLTGNAALAKNGCDSVLSGLIAASLARRREHNTAFLEDLRVAAAVYLHGLTGDFARDMLHENTVLASDLLETLDEAFRDCESQMDRGLFYLHR